MPTVFVDRDGTLNVDQVRRVDVGALELRPKAREAVQEWSRAGWRIIGVTNQSGIGRGHYAVADMERFHRALELALGHKLDAWYYCPHLPQEGCACRKPGTLLLERAAHDFGLDLRETFFVGDSWRDVEAGRRVGARTVRVPSGSDERPSSPDHEAADLLQAALWTLAQRP